MEKLFVPYVGKRPAPIVINGHRLLIVTEEKDMLSRGLSLCGGNRVRTLPSVDSEQEKEDLLAKLAVRSNAGIVLAPREIGIEELLASLQSELPWLH